MSKKVTEMTPEFSHRAGRVLESPYFKAEHGSDEFDRLFEEKDKLRDAITDGEVYSYDDLSDEAKAIWDRAEAAQKEWEEFAAQDTEGYGRFVEDWTGYANWRNPFPGESAPATVPTDDEGFPLSINEGDQPDIMSAEDTTAVSPPVPTGQPPAHAPPGAGEEAPPGT